MLVQRVSLTFRIFDTGTIFLQVFKASVVCLFMFYECIESFEAQALDVSINCLYHNP